MFDCRIGGNGLVASAFGCWHLQRPVSLTSECADNLGIALLDCVTGLILAVQCTDLDTRYELYEKTRTDVRRIFCSDIPCLLFLCCLYYFSLDMSFSSCMLFVCYIIFFFCLFSLFIICVFDWLIISSSYFLFVFSLMILFIITIFYSSVLILIFFFFLLFICLLYFCFFYFFLLW